jgi:cellulose synthase/poly-beta-1,6-N-acetylglucosamine synthase-like glycosyltransferase
MVSIAVLVLTAAVLALLVPFATHRTYLLWLASARRRGGGREASHRTSAWVGPLPRVTIQLPVYNERAVVARLIDAACQVDYPHHLLEVQVLDDSNDDTVELAAERVAYWRSRGVRVDHVRRQRRTGFKAGALAEGAARARGEFLLVLDADFVAPPDIVMSLLSPFQDAGVGMVQARWDHLNEAENGLTRAQASLLDGHFYFEQGGRYRGGRFFNFNGTGGMWRRRCLVDAGGWRADTLTEDLDLSYRAQMRGWRFVFLEDVGVPGEIPASVSALKVQQRRWSQGGIQTARKILPELLQGPWPLAVKGEAVIHLCGHMAHPLTLMLGLLLFPSAVARRSLGLEEYLFMDLVVFAMATLPFVVFYAAAARRRGKPWRGMVGRVVSVLSVGIGLSAPVSRAVARGMRGTADPFVRTPKRGWVPGTGYSAPRLGWDVAFELGLAALMLSYLAAAGAGADYASMPFIALFASGYVRLGLGGLFSARPTTNGVQEQHAPEGQPDHGSRPGGLVPVAGLVVGG